MENCSIEPHCFNCKYWLLSEPAVGGLVDIGICSHRLISTNESSSCPLFKEENESRKEAMRMVRKHMMKWMQDFKNDAYSRKSRELKVKAINCIVEDIRKYLLQVMDD